MMEGMQLQPRQQQQRLQQLTLDLMMTTPMIFSMQEGLVARQGLHRVH